MCEAVSKHTIVYLHTLPYTYVHCLKLTATGVYLSVASPVPQTRHGDDELPPIREIDDEVNGSVEHQHHSPECDQTTSAEVH